MDGRLNYEGIFIADTGKKLVLQADLNIKSEQTSQSVDLWVRVGEHFIPLVFLQDGTVLIPKDAYDEGLTKLKHLRQNESRAMVPALGKDDPPLLSAHIYDPGTHQSIFLNPRQRLARESLIVPRGQPGSKIPILGFHDGTPSAPLSLGQQTVGSTLLEGTRKTWTVAAAQSGTGKPLLITDDYWYASAFSVYLILRHNDPRTGEQSVAVRQVKAGEPDPHVFAVPSGYKTVDETPPQ